MCGSRWAARRLFAVNSPAIGKKNNAADRSSPRNHRPQGVMQRVPRGRYCIGDWDLSNIKFWRINIVIIFIGSSLGGFKTELQHLPPSKVRRCKVRYNCIYARAIPLAPHISSRYPALLMVYARVRPAIQGVRHHACGHNVTEHLRPTKAWASGAKGIPHIYAQPVGKLRKELIGCLRQPTTSGVPCSKGKDRLRQIPDMLSIHVRPPEIEDCQFPGHREGDVINPDGHPNSPTFGHLKIPHPERGVTMA